MSMYIKIIVFSFAMLLSVTSIASPPTPISSEDAAKKTFSNVCNTQYNTTTTFNNAIGYTEWPADIVGSRASADRLVAATTDVCIKAENEIKLILNAMRDRWNKACIAEKCEPSSSSNTGSETNCDSGEVTVTNKGDPNLKCTYEIKKGKAEPKPFSEQKDEKCWYGDGKGGNMGYANVTAYVPPEGVTPKLFMNLSCRRPGYVGDLSIYMVDDDEPKEVPKDEPKKDDPKEAPKDDK